MPRKESSVLFPAIAVLIASAAVAYAIAAALAAPRGSFLRSKRGMWLLAILGLTFLPLPPQMVSMDAAMGPLAGMLGTVGEAFAMPSALAWPAALGKGTYIALWLVSSIAAFLIGIRIWQLGSPEWRGGANRVYDASPASRVNALLPLANSLDEALGTLARVQLGARDVERVADDVRGVGRRYSADLPDKDGAVYQLVARHVPPAVAGALTGYLLEGAGRRSIRS